MSKYETGPRKGQNILNEIEPGVRWTCWMNNIGVNVDFDKQWNPTNTFSVTERLQGNATHVWISGVPFQVAIELAERLVVGDRYMPQSRLNSLKAQTFDYDIGDFLPSDFHMHQLNGMQMPDLFTYDDDSRMEISKEAWMGIHGKNERAVPNKVGVLVSVEGEDSIPDRVMVTYRYDDRFFTALLRRKSEKTVGSFFSGLGIELTQS